MFCFKRSVIRLFLMLAVSVCHAAGTWYVTTNGAGDGTSWTSAFSNIQHGVDAATNLNDTVMVSNGMYVLASQIVITNAIILRSVNNNPADTIVNGGFVPDISTTTNNRCLLLSNSAAYVSGFTFSNGAILTETNWVRGGGVMMYGGLLSNCHVRNNILFSPTQEFSKTGCGGGGIGILAGTVAVCRVTDNVVTQYVTDATTGHGGGINSIGGHIINCTVSSNRVYKGQSSGSPTYGGGIRLSRGSVKSSLISHNRMENGVGGGLWIENGSMEGSTVMVNYAKGWAGGLEIRRGTISNCVISGNSVDGVNMNGGGVVLRTGSANSVNIYETTVIGNTNGGVRVWPTLPAYPVVIRDCVVENNTAYGVYIQNSSNSHCLNTTVCGNRNGPGIICTEAQSGYIRNCLVVSNYGMYMSTYGGGLNLGANCRTVSVSCCTFASNGVAGIRLVATVPDDLLISSCVIHSNGINGTNDVFDSPGVNAGVLKYSCIGTNPDSHFTGDGLIIGDPHFVNAAEGDFRLRPSSPCVNRGAYEEWMAGAGDRDGNPRIRNRVVDMGCYETFLRGSIYSIR